MWKLVIGVRQVTKAWRTSMQAQLGYVRKLVLFKIRLFFEFATGRKIAVEYISIDITY